MTDTAITHWHLFCGLGGAAKGGQHVEVSTGNLRGMLRCVGGVDSDPEAVAAFRRYVGAPGTVLDLFTREQYRDYHGEDPPSGWREATIEDLRESAGGVAPDIVTSSPPCQGHSSLISENKAATDKYQALNALTLRGIALALEAFADDPPAFWLLENVPRLVNRGSGLLGEIVARLEDAGYATAYTIPDLGETGGLAQSRKRLHLVARHRERVPVHVFEPPRRPLRAVGEVLGALPLPGDLVAGPLHELPRLWWKTWLRLALIPAGGDWRDLQKFAVEGGVLRDYGIAPGTRWHKGVLGVRNWADPAVTIKGESLPTNGSYAVADPRAPGGWNHGAFGVRPWDAPAGVVTTSGRPSSGTHAVADPRIDGHPRSVQHGVIGWGEPSPVITSNPAPGGGRAAIADPRYGWHPGASSSKVRVGGWGEPARTVTGADRVGSGMASIADPRLAGVRMNNVFKVLRFDEPSVAVTAGQTPTSGGIGVADPRLGCAPRRGAYGVVPWEAPAATVTGSACHDNGRFTVADPREPSGGEEAFELPGERDQGVFLIQALDGTWHRPMTTLERAALQGLVDIGSMVEFTRAVRGASKSVVSSWIGNAIPPPAMTESLRAAGMAILLSRAGETFVLSNSPVWVRPFARAVLMTEGF